MWNYLYKKTEYLRADYKNNLIIEGIIMEVIQMLMMIVWFLISLLGITEGSDKIQMYGFRKKYLLYFAPFLILTAVVIVSYLK